MSQNEEAYQALIDLLAMVYGRINFSKIKVKSILDVWNHRVRAAASRPSIEEAISRLANFFGIQSLPEESLKLIAVIKPVEQIVLDRLAREHIPIAMAAYVRAKETRKTRIEKQPLLNLESAND